MHVHVLPKATFKTIYPQNKALIGLVRYIILKVFYDILFITTIKYNESFPLKIAPIYRRRIVIDDTTRFRDVTLSNKKW